MVAISWVAPQPVAAVGAHQQHVHRLSGRVLDQTGDGEPLDLAHPVMDLELGTPVRRTLRAVEQVNPMRARRLRCRCLSSTGLGTVEAGRRGVEGDGRPFVSERGRPGPSLPLRGRGAVARGPGQTAGPRQQDGSAGAFGSGDWLAFGAVVAGAAVVAGPAGAAAPAAMPR